MKPPRLVLLAWLWVSDGVGEARGLAEEALLSKPPSGALAMFWACPRGPPGWGSSREDTLMSGIFSWRSMSRRA